MNHLFRYAVLGFLASLTLATIACARSGDNVLASEDNNKTSLFIVSKDSEGDKETLQVSLEGKSSPLLWFGSLDLDNQVEEEAVLLPANFEGDDGRLTKLVNEDEELILIALYYTHKNSSAPKALIFKGKVGGEEFELVKDQDYLTDKNLEEDTGFSGEEIIDQLIEWLRTEGLAGIETFNGVREDVEAGN